MRSRRQRLFFLLLLSLFTLVLRAHSAHASEKAPSFADILEKVTDGHAFEIQRALLAMGPHLTDRQRKQLRDAYDSLHESTGKPHDSSDFALLYMSGDMDPVVLRSVAISFGNDFLQLGVQWGENDQLLSDLFLSVPMPDSAGFENFEMSREALEKFHAAYKKGDAKVMKAVHDAEAIFRRAKMNKEHRRLANLYFQRLKKEGFRHYQDKCDENLN